MCRSVCAWRPFSAYWRVGGVRVCVSFPYTGLPALAAVRLPHLLQHTHSFTGYHHHHHYHHHALPHPSPRNRLRLTSQESSPPPRCFLFLSAPHCLLTKSPSPCTAAVVILKSISMDGRQPPSVNT
ncbi:hypothetical protein E2C01_006496 [Portunus trituberculatus]|uniref:Uncharacterized protein n=1 Tax=Portunus trituberculatus TaxID=210409 RepID=A0A5B7CVC3_PORTR|nr:hypothetical protein [Portunus trituberculatus]